MTVEVTKEHLRIVRNAALHVYRTNLFGWRVGVDELESQGLVILWEAVQDYDEDRGRFEPFLTTRVRQRLVDWLRTHYGRASKAGEPNRRMQHYLRNQSLDEIAEWTDGDHHPAFWDHRSVEDQVMDRLDLEATFREMAKLGEGQLAALVGGLQGVPDVELAAEQGIAKGTVATQRSHARRKLARRTGIERVKHHDGTKTVRTSAAPKAPAPRKTAPCSNCGAAVPLSKPSKSGEHWCSERECRRARERFYYHGKVSPQRTAPCSNCGVTIVLHHLSQSGLYWCFERECRRAQGRFYYRRKVEARAQSVG